ncbi:MAG TPA: DegT/DnrJ/EryC1/StrS family aminotransferase [Saprospiraceae bacterium]|nr:DegT/DnrJ/EryC1/StrS family aminotransferase [Saprospiraceae bacterium]HMV24054.1 DegT/DnrJ/EryC1/StrS family aminotransferase [Saprospiraceae bacterium]HMX82435.1 DegT/DnrJ/EryC1/StrS family aminotransferase [Saprospiraceae bacterium]HMX84903.1 DegT/DnrJ/EryC1/StrS family aminotransferase [Saprospiraceae bacterium]HMZ72103.1 DegT/DnrJ/EryC1/StrS family aminotransferase [Saprospiraceae bacterium]
MHKIQMVDLHNQYLKIKSETDAAIQDVLDQGYYINGAPVHKFSENLATYLNVAHVIPCANGTDALQIALMALELQPGDEVITSPFTFVATAEVIALLKLKPVFVDIDPDTYLIDVNKIEAAITPRTRCIIPVHLFGQIANMEKINEIAQRHNLYVVEDNAQAIGADYTFANGNQVKAGTIGHIGCTSFYPSKNLGCYGDGGALMTNDGKLAEKIKVICNHGSKQKYYHEEIGVNSRLDSIQAGILDIKLKHLDQYITERQRAAEYYDRHLSDIDGIQIPVRTKHSTHVFHQYTLFVDKDRDRLKDSLQESGIPSMVYYPVPLHVQAAYTGDGYKAGDFPHSEKAARHVLSLPMHTELSDEMLGYICTKIREAFI